MLDINFIKENPEKVKKGVADKNYDPQIVDRVLKVDETRRQLIGEVEKWRQERNKLFYGEKAAFAKATVVKGKKIKEMLRRLEPDLAAVEEELKNLLYEIPNLPAGDVKFGKDEAENEVLRKWPASRRGATASRGGRAPRKYNFKVKDHLELGELLDIIDVKRAGKVSGSRFGYLKNEGVLLEFALINFAFETLLPEGFKLIIPPVMISLGSMKEMGYLGHGGKDNMYVLEKDDLVLVGTSEQSIGPMHKNEVLEEKDLPLRYLGFSTCFRREAGSYGKDTRGTLRVHQFNKVEMFSFTKPEDSDKEHEFLLSLEEKLMQALKLPYQVIKMCSGDLGDPAARKYDIEAWFPSEGKYRETHSTSTCADYQARRLNTKFERQKGGLEFVHTLNGTAFSERPLLAILENYQQEDGSVFVPEVLQKYTGFKRISPRKV